MANVAFTPEQKIASTEAKILELLAIRPMCGLELDTYGGMRIRFKKLDGLKIGLPKLLKSMASRGLIESFEQMRKQNILSAEATIKDTMWRLKAI